MAPCQALGARSERGAHPRGALVAEEVRVRRASRPAPHVVAEPAGERAIALVVCGVLPQKQRMHDEARLAAGDRRVVGADAGDRAAPGDDEEL